MTDASHLRRSGRWRHPALWLVGGLLLATAAFPGGLAAAHLVRVAPQVGVARPLVTNPSFTVNLTDSPSYLPRYLNATVSATSPVTITIALNNTGSLTHTFTMVNVSQSGYVLNRSWTPERLDSYFAVNGTLADANLSGHTTGSVTVSLPAASTFRSFEFVSTIPYQFQAGMWGFLNLTPTGPTVIVEENTTDQFRFVPSALSSGTNVSGAVTFHVHITNEGSLDHTFTVSSQANVSLTSLQNLSIFPPLVNVSVGQGPPVWANFTVPRAGVYEYVCTVQGHFAQGMYGFLYVGVPVPPAPASPSTAIVEVPLLVGSAILLGIGVALVFASAYGGRLPKRPDSEGHHRHGRA